MKVEATVITPTTEKSEKMTENPEMVFRTEDGVIVRVDIEAITTMFQEVLYKGKLVFVRTESEAPDPR